MQTPYHLAKVKQKGIGKWVYPIPLLKKLEITQCLPMMTRVGGYVGLVSPSASLQSNCVTRLSLSWLQCGILQGNPRGKKAGAQSAPPHLLARRAASLLPVTPWAWAGSKARDPGPPRSFTKIKPVNDWPLIGATPTIPPAFPDPEVQDGP